MDVSAVWFEHPDGGCYHDGHGHGGREDCSSRNASGVDPRLFLGAGGRSWLEEREVLQKISAFL